MDVLKINPWNLRKRVLPQNTDHAGVMWHGAYLSWMEEARVEALSQVGLEYVTLSSQGFEMPVVRLEINYLRALSHGDEVLLESWALPRDGARWPWRTRFQTLRNEIAAESKVELVFLKLSKTSRQVMRNPPDSIASALLELQKGPN